MIINRLSAPHRYDIAPFGSMCKVKTPNPDVAVIYVQLSFNEDNPRWEEFGKMPSYYSDKHLKRELSSLIKC